MRPDIVVRLYDRGGLGDIAAGLRVAHFLDEHGYRTGVLPTSTNAHDKMLLLGTNLTEADPSREESSLIVDVAGWYRDFGVLPDRAPPHVLVEDMDNDLNANFGPLFVGSYLMTGIGENYETAPAASGVRQPMFFRGSDEEPRDAHDLVARALGLSNRPRSGPFTSNAANRTTARHLSKIERLAFSHIAPTHENAKDVLEHPYLESVRTASDAYRTRLGIGMFVGRELEDLIVQNARTAGWNTITSDRTSTMHDRGAPTLVFLGPQPQRTTSQLFASAGFANLVTGDGTLSDGLYELLTRKGPGFFYDAPIWKEPTLRHLERIMHDENGTSGMLRSGGTPPRIGNPESVRNDEALEGVVTAIGDPDAGARYAGALRRGLVTDIERRYPNAHTNGTPPAGTAYLIQDATYRLVGSILNDASLRDDVENARALAIEDQERHIDAQTRLVVEGSDKDLASAAD